MLEVYLKYFCLDFKAPVILYMKEGYIFNENIYSGCFYTAVIQSGWINMSQALGNRIKHLRLKFNLTQTGLAEHLNVSHAYIGLIEKGTRSGSEEMLTKLAEFFKVDVSELTALREDQHKVVSISDKISNTNSVSLPIYIEEFINTLSSLEEKTCLDLITQFQQQIEEKLYSYLKPYETKEIKLMVLDIKRQWINIVHDPSVLINEREINGYIQTNEFKRFFQLSLDNSALGVTLLYTDQKEVTMFENWLNEWAIRSVTELIIPSFTKPQKVVKFLWFSPSISIIDKFLYLQNNQFQLDKLDCTTHQLNWFIQNHLIENQKQPSTFS